MSVTTSSTPVRACGSWARCSACPVQEEEGPGTTDDAWVVRCEAVVVTGREPGANLAEGRQVHVSHG
jgi:hypothetical protein